MTRTWWALLGTLLAGAALLVAAGVALLWAINPVADEWHCVEGKAPAHNEVGGGACFREGSILPEGYTWDRWGNRPMAYNCDDDGWVEVTNASGNRHDCVREGTDLPGRWRVVDP